MPELRIPGFVTVRTSSSRLPSKCLMQFGEGNVLEHMIRRARSFGIDPIVCTSTDPSDDVIERIAKTEGAKCFRGSLKNKLKRWSDCADHFAVESFHTLDADDPFFDAEEITRSMQLLATGQYDMICPTNSSSAGGASVGYSLTSQIVKRAVGGLGDEVDTEMAWYYLEKLPSIRSLTLPESTETKVKVRLTLDYQEDYWLLSSVGRIVGFFTPREAVNQLFLRNPELYKVNWFRNEEWKSGQIAKKPSFNEAK